MNKLIKELAEQAEGTKKHVPSVWQFYDHELEKFAELIVRECVEICRSDDWEDQRGWGKLYAHKIKKHFGVGE